MFSHEIEQDKGLPAPSDPIEHDHLIQGFWEENTFATQDLLHLFENEPFVGYNDFFKRFFADHDIYPYDKDKLENLCPYVKDKYIEFKAWGWSDWSWTKGLPFVCEKFTMQGTPFKFF
jgi:hypothetical protein